MLTEERTGTTGEEAGERREAGRSEFVHQLQEMIDDLATQAGPVLKEVAEKAAELAQKAAEAATPYAARAADVAAEVSLKLSEKSREVAADLHRQAEANEARAAGSPDGEAPRTGATGETAPSEDVNGA